MRAFLKILSVWSVAGVFVFTEGENAQPSTTIRRQLDPLSGGDVLRREIGDDISDFKGSDVLRTLLIGRVLDSIHPAVLLKMLNSLTNGEMLRSMSMVDDTDLMNVLSIYPGGEAIERLNILSGGKLLKSLDNIEGTDVIMAMDQARRTNLKPFNKRTLDTLSGMAFGESKRMDSLSGAALGYSKRNFDEIDNVGFNGWAKRMSTSHNTPKKNGMDRQRMLALARRSSYGPFKSGYGSLAKKNFDEIDRTGFEGFSKREG